MTDLRQRYERANALLAHKLDALVPAAAVEGRWDGDQLRYVVHTSAGPVDVLVDPVRATRQVLGPQVAATPTEPDASRSPDGRWTVRVRAGDLVIVDTATGEQRRLTDDAQDGVAWAGHPDFGGPSTLARSRGAVLPVLVSWSPDSRRFYAHRIDQRQVPVVSFSESTPPDGRGPRLHQLHYPCPGDPLPQITHHVFVAADGTRTEVGVAGEVVLAPPVAWQRVWWSADSAQLWLLDETRGRRAARLWRWEDGVTECVLEESDERYVEVTPMIGGRPLVRTLASGEVIWWSERDGWGHLWLYADTTWRQLTRGDLQVREIVALDESTRTVWVLAGGGVPGECPYFRHLYAVGLDDGPMRRLTSEDADHAVTAHPAGSWFLDCYASASTLPTTVLRAADGAVVLHLEQADVSALELQGWSPPEQVCVRAADGETELWGLLFPPHDLDPAGSYPVLESVYPGPQASRQARPALPGAPIEPYLLDTGGSAAAWAALGFAVLVLDGRGTPLRSRAFHDHGWGDLGSVALDDHVAALHELAATRPWMDLERVGIVGHSGGGYASARAVLLRPDTYKAAVATSGNHDPRTYVAAWGEQWQGLVGDADYDSCATAQLAPRLQGRLLLIHGECDDNVLAAQSLQLVESFLRADKDVELLLVPGGEHLFREAAPYVIRRRWDFLVRHLLGHEPPVGFRVDGSAVTGRFAT